MCLTQLYPLLYIYIYILERHLGRSGYKFTTEFTITTTTTNTTLRLGRFTIKERKLDLPPVCVQRLSLFQRYSIKLACDKYQALFILHVILGCEYNACYTRGREFFFKSKNF